MKAILISIALAFSLKAVCADELQYAIVSGVESIQKVRTASSRFPWDRAASDEIVVSLSCGFAQVVYDRVTTPGFAKLNDDPNTKPWKTLVHIGHYCKIREFVLDSWHLVAYREWRGQDYLISYAEIRVAEDDRLYIDDSKFFEDTGLDSRLDSVARPGVSPNCKTQVAECTSHRIYLDAIPMRANKRLELSRGSAQP